MKGSGNTETSGLVTVQDLFSFNPVDYNTRAELLERSSSSVMPSVTATVPTASPGPGTPMMTPKHSLMLAVYNQCWPTPSFFKNITNLSSNNSIPFENNNHTSLCSSSSSSSNSSSSRPTKEWVRNQLVQQHRRDAGQLSQNSSSPQLNLDKNTLRWRSWTGEQASTPDGTTVENNTDSQFYRLTAAEFRRLTEQVREVNGQAQQRYRGAGFKKFYPTTSTTTGDKASSVYRSQLASSLQAFKRKDWAPYEHETPDPFYPTRGRSSSSRLGSRATSAATSRSRTSYRPVTPFQPHKQRSRPSSGPSRGSDPEGSTSRDPSQSVTNDFDSLTPSVVYELSEGQQPESVYGDRPESVLDDEIPDDDGTQSLDDFTVSESGTLASTRHLATTDRDTDIDTDEENVYEPKLEDLERNQISIPNLELRPEKFDSVYIPGFPKGDRRKYDFDAENVHIPPYEFASPFPESIGRLNFRELCADDKNWRDVVDSQQQSDIDEDVHLAPIVDRLLEIEKLQMKTEESEDARKERTKSAKARNGVRSRTGSARVPGGRQRERWCCPDCTQPACVGNCPTKEESHPPCLLCREKHCAGTCTENAYCAHTRVDRNDSEKSRTRLQTRPRSCTYCQKRHNAKLINANNLILGRPRSGHATFSRGQSSNKPTDLRPKSAGGAIVSSELEKDFEKFGLDPVVSVSRASSASQRPSTACSTSSKKSYRGRAGLIPGKSYFSQRRNSLTDSSARARLRLAAQRRKKSPKNERLKTAG